MKIGYVDSSVILNIILQESLTPIDLNPFDRLYTSQLTELECRRVLDRIRIAERIPDSELAQRYLELQDQLQSMYLLRFTQSIFRRACESFPVVVRSLDSIHLSSFILAQKSAQKSVKSDNHWTFVTHDHQLKAAIESLGFAVLG